MLYDAYQPIQSILPQVDFRVTEKDCGGCRVPVAVPSRYLEWFIVCLVLFMADWM
jgi:hypothetical protein